MKLNVVLTFLASGPLSKEPEKPSQGTGKN